MRLKRRSIGLAGPGLAHRGANRLRHRIHRRRGGGPGRASSCRLAIFVAFLSSFDVLLVASATGRAMRFRAGTALMTLLACPRICRVASGSFSVHRGRGRSDAFSEMRSAVARRPKVRRQFDFPLKKVTLIVPPGPSGSSSEPPSCSARLRMTAMPNFGRSDACTSRGMPGPSSPMRSVSRP